MELSDNLSEALKLSGRLAYRQKGLVRNLSVEESEKLHNYNRVLWRYKKSVDDVIHRMYV